MYQGWYNTYEGSKVSKVVMCEVSSMEKMVKNKPKKKV
jgi:thiaminase